MGTEDGGRGSEQGLSTQCSQLRIASRVLHVTGGRECYVCGLLPFNLVMQRGHVISGSLVGLFCHSWGNIMNVFN
jgi:hypothetical protein